MIDAPRGWGRLSDPAKGRLLVMAQFLLLGLLIGLPGRRTSAVGAVAVSRLAQVGGLAMAGVGAAGLGRGLTASPLPNEHARLRTGGLYRWVRHPIYTGLLLFAAGRAAGRPDRLRLVVLGLLAVLLSRKARWEEARLRQIFAGYGDYAAVTGRFLPRLRRRGGPGQPQA